MPETKKTLFDSIRHGNTMWIGMIFFASAWMFVLGIFVGRGTAPVKFDIEKLQKELLALKKTVIDADKKQLKVYMETAKKKMDLGFYEALKMSEGGDKPGKTPLKQTSVRATKRRERSEISKGKTDSAPREAGSETEAGPRATNLTIQVGSFKEMATADRVVAELRGTGYQAYRTIGKVAGKGVWYRVRVGYYADKADARDTIQRLKKDRYKPLLIKWQ